MTDTTKSARIEAALDTLAAICALSDEEISSMNNIYEKRSAAEEILRHYREAEMVRNITITVNGAVPVRPMTRAEMGEN